MEKVKRDMNIEQLKKIYQIFKAYQQANTSPKPNLSEEEKRLRELERNNPYFSRYVYSEVTIDE
ncbi:hypothetical protein FJZ31_35235 [Candidatus Poribacteria bacterium]|nr:hypothetical protein [Candidatus Poribacteria bacterium]